jgi:hypothetical protein
MALSAVIAVTGRFAHGSKLVPGPQGHYFRTPKRGRRSYSRARGSRWSLRSSVDEKHGGARGRPRRRSSRPPFWSGPRLAFHPSHGRHRRRPLHRGRIDVARQFLMGLRRRRPGRSDGRTRERHKHIVRGARRGSIGTQPDTTRTISGATCGNIGHSNALQRPQFEPRSGPPRRMSAKRPFAISERGNEQVYG